MTATEVLRRLLDERGVEWMPSAWSTNDETFYKVGEVGYLATELSSGKMKICIEGYPTPEQAIAATLGVDAKPTQAESLRTCHRLPADNYDEMCIVRSHGYEREFGYWKCSECGTNCFEGARYCMNCGAKVVDE